MMTSTESNLFHVPTLEFHEGRERVTKVLSQSLSDWQSSMRESDNTWWGYQDDQFVTDYRDFLELYWKKKDPQQCVRLFSNENPIEKMLRIANREVRVVPKGFAFTSTFWICGSYLIVIMHRNKPQYAFQIQDSVLAENVKTIFKLLWKFSEGR